MKVCESEALELLNIMAQGKVIYSYKPEKTKWKLRAYLVLPICFLLSPVILLSVFTAFMFMKAGFKHSKKAAFLSFVAVVMALRNKILIQENNKQEPVKNKTRHKKPKYNLFPGMVKSKDGDEHYISPAALISLYCVDPKECIIIMGYTKCIDNSLISLRPRSSGNYIVPKCKILGKSVEA